MSTSAELLERAKAVFQRGEREQARRYVEQALELDPASDQAWLWLAGVATEPKDQQTYLSNALHHNPANEQARQGLDWLKSKHPELFAPAAATQLLPPGATGFEPPPASYGSGFSPPANPAGSGTPAYGGGFAPSGQAGFEPPPASYSGGFAPSGGTGFEPPASYSGGFAPPAGQGGFAPPASYGGGYVPPMSPTGFEPSPYGGGYGPPAGQGGFAPPPAGPYAGQPVATPMYGPPGAMPPVYGAPVYGAPGAMPPVYGAAGPYYMPDGMAVSQGKNIGCVTAYLIVSGALSLLAMGFIFLIARVMREGSRATQREYAAFNEQLAEQFISLPALAAVLAGFTVLYIAAAVGVGKRSLWGWYLGLGVLGLNILFSAFTLLNGVTFNILGAGLSIFLVTVLVRNREVFR